MTAMSEPKKYFHPLNPSGDTRQRSRLAMAELRSFWKREGYKRAETYLPPATSAALEAYCKATGLKQQEALARILSRALGAGVEMPMSGLCFEDRMTG